jgi:hypothetical protein
MSVTWSTCLGMELKKKNNFFSLIFHHFSIFSRSHILFFLNQDIFIKGGILVTILIRLMLYIIYIALIAFLSQPLPTSLKAIAGGFLVLFHISIWSPSTIYHHLKSPSFILPPPSSTLLHTLYQFYSPAFHYLIFKLMFKWVSQCMPTVDILYFGKSI